jgi:hypothetical protein
MIVLLAMTIYEYGYKPLEAEIQMARQLRDSKTETLKKYLGIIAEIPQLEKELSRLDEEKRQQGQYLVQGQTQTVAASTIQDMVSSVITSRGGNTQSQRIDKPTKSGKFNIINIHFGAIVPDIKALTDILLALQANKPTIVIKEIDLRLQNFRDPRQLFVHMTVTAMTEAK